MRIRPPPPDALACALQDQIHPTSGRLLAATRIVRTRRVEGERERVAPTREKR
jgi:hypothetical protein